MNPLFWLTNPTSTFLGEEMLKTQGANLDSKPETMLTMPEIACMVSDIPEGISEEGISEDF